MTWTRRQFLELGASSLALASLQCGRRSKAPPVSPSQPGPRYVVLLYLDGGIDPILTINPKTKDQVANEVDAPNATGEIVEAGPIRLGAHFASLAPLAPRMTIVNGVALDTANHNTGWGQISRLRTGVTGVMPGILDIVGEHRDGQPLGCISLGDLAPIQYTPGHTDGHAVFAIHDAGREQLGSLSHALAAEANGLTAAGRDPRLQRTAENYRQVGVLAERLQDVPHFEVQAWDRLEEKEKRLTRDLQRILWALEHDLTRCAFIKIRPYGGWDSHNLNLMRQRNCSRSFTDLFAHFMRELETRRNAHGVLAEQTLIVAGSEIGRFPRLNGNSGKDHFPETSFMLLGPGVRRGVFGATDNRMSALPIDDSGQRATRGGHKIMLDDLGATLLAATAIDPEPYGYRGKVLRFLAERA